MTADELLDHYDASIQLACSTGCAWEAEVRLTVTNPEGAPSRSVTFYVAGAATPIRAMTDALADAEAWLAEPGNVAMPVPEWLTPEYAQRVEARAQEQAS